jgi:hypothetical protein
MAGLGHAALGHVNYILLASLTSQKVDPGISYQSDIKATRMPYAGTRLLKASG